MTRALRRIALAVAVIVVGWGLGASPCTSAVVNGGFEVPVIGSGYLDYRGGQSFPGWAVTGDSVDICGTYFPAASGRQCLDLSGYDAGGVYQDVPTIPGQSYLLRYAFAGNPNNPYTPVVKQMVAAFGTVSHTESFDTTGHSLANIGWSYRQYIAVPTATLTRLQFTSLTRGDSGPVVDDVSVTPVAMSRIFTSDFEQPVIPSYIVYPTGESVGGWTVTGHDVDVGAYPSAGGAQCLDLNGWNMGGIYRDLATVPGQTYCLDFAYAGNPNNPYTPAVKQMRLGFGSLSDTLSFNTTGHSAANIGWQSADYVWTATAASTRLEFTSLTSGDSGMFLDNIEVSAVTVVPQPPAVWAGVILLGGAVLNAFRRISRAQADQRPGGLLHESRWLP